MTTAEAKGRGDFRRNLKKNVPIRVSTTSVPKLDSLTTSTDVELDSADDVIFCRPIC